MKKMMGPMAWWRGGSLWFLVFRRGPRIVKGGGRESAGKGVGKSQNLCINKNGTKKTTTTTEKVIGISREK